MKVKNVWVCMLAMLLAVPTEGFSQKWLEKIGKAIEKVDDAVDKVSSSKGEKATIGSVDLQRGGSFRIVTNHPDFKVRVKRCEVSGKTCVIDLIMENVGGSDVVISAGRLGGMIAYDDEANQYVGDQNKQNIQIAIGDITQWLWGTEGITLMSEVPLKARIQIEGVSESATEFRRLEISLGCKAWNLDGNKKLTFRNLPISREGEE